MVKSENQKSSEIKDQVCLLGQFQNTLIYVTAEFTDLWELSKLGIFVLFETAAMYQLNKIGHKIDTKDTLKCGVIVQVL